MLKAEIPGLIGILRSIDDMLFEVKSALTDNRCRRNTNEAAKKMETEI